MLSLAIVPVVAGGVGAALLPPEHIPGGLTALPTSIEALRFSLEWAWEGGRSGSGLPTEPALPGEDGIDTLRLEGEADAPGSDAALPDPALHPPVLLVPGWSDRAPQLEDFRRRMVEAGWPEDRVVAMEFADPVGSNRAHAREVSAATEALRRKTGEERVDIVAFSMGGLAVRQFLYFEDGSALVRRAAFLGTPHRGTIAAVFAWGDGAREMIPGSPFLERLNTGRPLEGVEMASIRTSLDTRVVPGSSAMLPGAVNVEVCCPGHTGMLRDRETFAVVRNFLLLGAEALPGGIAIPAGSPARAGG
jgi:triacylglycerol lipase